MQRADANDSTVEVSLVGSTSIVEDYDSCPDPDLEEELDDLRLRILSLEHGLKHQSERIWAFRGMMSLAISAYLFFLLLGPVLDVLKTHRWPGLEPYQAVAVIEVPSLWALFTLFFPPSARRRSES